MSKEWVRPQNFEFSGSLYIRSTNIRFPVIAPVEKLLEGWHYYKNWKKIQRNLSLIAFSLQFTNPPESCNVLIYLFSNNNKRDEKNIEGWKIENQL